MGLEEQGQHLVFYDGTCGMCHKAVQFLLKHDKMKVFVFAPLQGETAAKMLGDWKSLFPDADTLVLVENYRDPSDEYELSKRIFAFGKGGLRICWLLGGVWAIPGAISFLPSFLYDWIYRWVARHRFQWFERRTCLVPKNGDVDVDLTRFLP